MVKLGFQGVEQNKSPTLSSPNQFSRLVMTAGTREIANYYREHTLGRTPLSQVFDRKPVKSLTEPISAERRQNPLIAYSGWKEPRTPLSPEDIEQFASRKGDFDIWVREPMEELYHRSHKLVEPNDYPDKRLIRLLKTILRNAHEDCITLQQMHQSLWPDVRGISVTQILANKKKIANAISEVNMYFSKCIKLRWLDDYDPFPRIILLKHSFSYCLMEPAERERLTV